MKILFASLLGLALLCTCSLTDESDELPGSGLYVVGGGLLSSPSADNHCIGLASHGETNLLFYSGTKDGQQGIFVSQQVEDLAFNPPELITGTSGLSNFTVYALGTKNWIFVETSSNILVFGSGSTGNPVSLIYSQSPIKGRPVCVLGTEANFPNLTSSADEVALIYAVNGTNIMAAKILLESLTSLGQAGVPIYIETPVNLFISPTPVAAGGSYLRGSTLGMDRDSVLMSRFVPKRGYEIILSDLTGQERILSAFSSPLDDCSPVYSVRERALYMTSRAFAPENTARTLNIFRWKSRGLNEQSAYESGPSSRTWAITIGSPAREEIVGLVPMTNGNLIIVGRTAVKGSDDVFIAGLDPAGELLWQKSIGTPGMAEQPTAVIHSGDSILIVGTRTDGGTSSGFIITYKAGDGANGEVKAYTASTNEGSIEFNAAALKTNGTLAITGTLRPSNGKSQAILATWDPKTPGSFSGTSFGVVSDDYQGLAIGADSDGILIGGMAGTYPALIMYEGGYATFHTATIPGRIRVVQNISSGFWVFGGVTGNSGIIGSYTGGPAVTILSKTITDSPVSDFLPGLGLFAFERADATIAHLGETGLTLATPMYSWGLTGVVEQRPRLFDSEGGLYITAEAQLPNNNNDGLIIKLGTDYDLVADKPGVYSFGAQWTAPTSSDLNFKDETDEGSSPLTLTGSTATWVIQDTALTSHYWYR